MFSGFNPVGFDSPLLVGIVLLLFFCRSSKKKVFTREAMITGAPMFVLIVIFTLLSTFVVPLQVLHTHSISVNYPVFCLVFVYQVYMVAIGYDGFALSIAYLMGFIVGLSSDLSALNYLTGFVVFGGAGIYDSDFWVPIYALGLTLASILIIQSIRKIRSKAD